MTTKTVAENMSDMEALREILSPLTRTECRFLNFLMDTAISHMYTARDSQGDYVYKCNQLTSIVTELANIAVVSNSLSL